MCSKISLSPSSSSSILMKQKQKLVLINKKEKKSMIKMMICKIWRNGTVMQMSLTKKIIRSMNSLKFSFLFFWLFHLAIPMSRFISLKQKKKGLTDNELRDWFAHVVFRGKCYSEENYLKSPLKINIYDSIYPFNNQCPSHIETSQLSAL